jgi:hypothetical protein
MYLKGAVEDKMKEIVEGILENRQDLKNEDPEQVFDTYFEEMFNSYGDWWDFNQSDLTIKNINELLESYENLRNEVGELEGGLNVTYLLKLYGVWFGKSLTQKYVNLLKDGLEQTEDSDDE